MMKQPRIAQVGVAEKPFHIRVTWVDDTSSTVDLWSLIDDLDVFAPLADPNFLAQVTVDEWGWSIRWNDQIDLGADTLWRMALEQLGEAMAPAAFLAWRTRNKLTLSGAAEALGLGRRIIVYYEQGKKLIPKTVLLATKGYDAERVAALKPSTMSSVSSSEMMSQWICKVIEEKMAKGGSSPQLAMPDTLQQENSQVVKQKEYLKLVSSR